MTQFSLEKVITTCIIRSFLGNTLLHAKIQKNHTLHKLFLNQLSRTHFQNFTLFNYINFFTLVSVQSNITLNFSHKQSHKSLSEALKFNKELNVSLGLYKRMVNIIIWVITDILGLELLL